MIEHEFEGTDKVEELRSYWDAADEDSYKVGYDGTNPDATTGSSYDLEVTYKTDGSHTDSGGVAVAAAVDSTGVIILVGAIAIAVLAVAYFAISSRKPKKRKKKKN